MNNIICIAGPTASGKTALAVELAKKFNGEVVSCDSMQIYRRMDIGTAKPTQDEMQGILADLGWELPEPIMTINWRPTPEGLSQLHETAMKVIK